MGAPGDAHVAPWGVGMHMEGNKQKIGFSVQCSAMREMLASSIQPVQ